jgi:hypothetical protein
MVARRSFSETQDRFSLQGGHLIIKAVGWNEHNKLFIRGQEYHL